MLNNFDVRVNRIPTIPFQHFRRVHAYRPLQLKIKRRYNIDFSSIKVQLVRPTSVIQGNSNYFDNRFHPGRSTFAHYFYSKNLVWIKDMTILDLKIGQVF